MTIPPKTRSQTNFQNKLQLLDDIGEGAFGCVIKCIDKTTQKFYAIKMIDYCDPQCIKYANRELTIHTKLSNSSRSSGSGSGRRSNHDNNNNSHNRGIVQLYGHYFISKPYDTLCLILEYCPFTLERYIKRQQPPKQQQQLQAQPPPQKNNRGGRGYLVETEACRIMIEITQTLLYIHSKGIIHRDIKPSNILLDTYLQPKIADFGISTTCSKSSSSSRSSNNNNNDSKKKKTTHDYLSDDVDVVVDDNNNKENNQDSNNAAKGTMTASSFDDTVKSADATTSTTQQQKTKKKTNKNKKKKYHRRTIIGTKGYTAPEIEKQFEQLKLVGTGGSRSSTNTTTNTTNDDDENYNDDDEKKNKKKKETATTTTTLEDIDIHSNNQDRNGKSLSIDSHNNNEPSSSSSPSDDGQRLGSRNNNIEYWDGDDGEDSFDSDDEDDDYYYMPFPTFPMGESYDQMVDVWSLGATLYSMATGIFPEEEYDDLVQQQQDDVGEDDDGDDNNKISSGNDKNDKNEFYDSYFGFCGDAKRRRKQKNQFQFDIPDHVSKEAKSLVGGLLEENPNDRISLQDVLQHPWIAMNTELNNQPTTTGTT